MPPRLAAASNVALLQSAVGLPLSKQGCGGLSLPRLDLAKCLLDRASAKPKDLQAACSSSLKSCLLSQGTSGKNITLHTEKVLANYKQVLKKLRFLLLQAAIVLF